MATLNWQQQEEGSDYIKNQQKARLDNVASDLHFTVAKKQKQKHNYFIIKQIVAFRLNACMT